MRHFCQQESDDVIGNLLADRIGFIRRISGIGQLGIHHRNHLFGVYLYALTAYAIHGMKNGYAVTPWWRTGYHDVGKLRHTRIMVMIQLDYHLFRPQQPGGCIANTAGKPNPAIWRDGGGFNDGNIDLAKKAVINHLRHFTQMEIDKPHLALINFLAQAR